MNQADKQEALRLVEEIATHAYTSSDFADRAKQCADLRALIERQDDTDGERWRFCLEHGFPKPIRPFTTIDQQVYVQVVGVSEYGGNTPNEATDAAMAAMKEKA